MTVDEAKALVKSRLSEKRYKHTINVKKMAVKLAKRYGADEEKAALAALLHDSAKELPKAEMLQIFADNAIIAKNAAKRPAPVWHGYAASVLCQTQWGVTDPEILSAIECHTTVNTDLAEFVFDQHDLFALERFLDELFDQGRFACTQKAGENINFSYLFCHGNIPFYLKVCLCC